MLCTGVLLVTRTQRCVSSVQTVVLYVCMYVRQTDSDMEWKFARTKLWMTYIDESSTLPVPLNMIPTTKSFRYALKFIVDLICRRDDDDKPETAVYDFSVSHGFKLK